MKSIQVARGWVFYCSWMMVYPTSCQEECSIRRTTIYWMNSRECPCRATTQSDWILSLTWYPTWQVPMCRNTYNTYSRSELSCQITLYIFSEIPKQTHVKIWYTNFYWFFHAMRLLSFGLPHNGNSQNCHHNRKWNHNRKWSPDGSECSHFSYTSI